MSSKWSWEGYICHKAFLSGKKYECIYKNKGLSNENNFTDNYVTNNYVQKFAFRQIQTSCAFKCF